MKIVDVMKKGFPSGCVQGSSAQLKERGGGGGGGWRPPLLFFENQKKCPDFGKKCLDCVHPQVKFVI